MIQAYAIVYHDAEMTFKCLSNLSVGNYLDLTVIHNMSPNFHDVETAIAQAAGKPRIITTETNLAADAFLRTMEVFPPYSDHKFVICTDGDILVEDVTQTIAKQKIILNQHEEVFCVSSRICMDNLPTKTFPEATQWVPKFTEAGDYLVGPGPHHFVMFRSVDIRPMVKWLRDNGQTWVDMSIDSFAKSRNQCFAILKDHWHWHLGWDAYADMEHPYTKMRMQKTFDETWMKR